MITNLNARLKKAKVLAALRGKLIVTINDVQRRIGILTPKKVITEMLITGDISSEWFVQRLIDSGWTMIEALNEFNILRHGPDGKNIVQLKDDAIERPPLPYSKPVHNTGVYHSNVPYLTPIANDIRDDCNSAIKSKCCGAESLSAEPIDISER